MSKYTFIKIKDAKDLTYVYKLKFVYNDKEGSLKRVSKDKIEQYYNKLAGKYSNNQIYWMIKRADDDCDRYIELHKNDSNIKPKTVNKKEYRGLSKKEYIEYLINKGYSDEDAEEKANAEYGEDDN